MDQRWKDQGASTPLQRQRGINPGKKQEAVQPYQAEIKKAFLKRYDEGHDVFTETSRLLSMQRRIGKTVRVFAERYSATEDGIYQKILILKKVAPS